MKWKLDQRHYAVKTFSKAKFDEPEYKKYVTREIEILPKINHPNIIKYEGMFEDDANIFVISQVGWVGSLRNFLIRYQKPISVELLRFWSIEILNALKYLEENKIVHRDLKPENILLDENFHIKIWDFGTAKIYDPKIVEEYYGKYDEDLDDSSDSDKDHLHVKRPALEMARSLVNSLILLLVFKGRNEELRVSWANFIWSSLIWNWFVGIGLHYFWVFGS